MTLGIGVSIKNLKWKTIWNYLNFLFKFKVPTVTEMNIQVHKILLILFAKIKTNKL
jgi:hypothetical protein